VDNGIQQLNKSAVLQKKDYSTQGFYNSELGESVTVVPVIDFGWPLVGQEKLNTEIIISEEKNR